MSTTRAFLTRAADALVEAYEWYVSLCKRYPEMQPFIGNVLLSANFLALRSLLEDGAKTGKVFDIRPYVLRADGAAVRVVDVEKQSRPREIAIWVDSAVGLPDPTIRVGTDAGATSGGGIRVKPGDVNELGVVPPNTTLWASSDVDLTIYVIERG